jgi:hypothetical protein
MKLPMNNKALDLDLLYLSTLYVWRPMHATPLKLKAAM